MDLGGGDSVTLKGGEGQFWCDDPKYAGMEIRTTWVVQGAGLPSLCELVPEEESQQKKKRPQRDAVPKR
jgi:hypothetical protein